MIFYDGTDIATHGTNPIISGFTTNTSFMKAGKYTNYSTFLQKFDTIIANRSISLQTFADTQDEIYKQAKDIFSLGKNVYSKVPIQNTQGLSNLVMISKLLNEGIKINITAVFTRDQIDNIVNMLSHSNTTTSVIISIFAGRISDTGVDPLPIVEYTVKQTEKFKNVAVLFAGVKDNASVVKAKEIGCHIITVPDNILIRLNRVGMSLEEMALDTVKTFHNDGRGFNIL